MTISWEMVSRFPRSVDCSSLTWKMLMLPSWRSPHNRQRYRNGSHEEHHPERKDIKTSLLAVKQQPAHDAHEEQAECSETVSDLRHDRMKLPDFTGGIC